MTKVSLATLALFAAAGCSNLDAGQADLVARAPGSTKAGLGVAISGSTDSHGGGGGNLVDTMDQIVIHVVAVAAHAAGTGWVQVSDQPALVDLLRLQDSAD